jgi:ribonuclease P protein component
MNVISSQTFPKYLTIRSTLDFKRVFAHGKKTNLEFVRVISLENSLGFTRIGIVVNKKELPKAVLRTRFKRVIREIFRKYKHNLGPKDYIVISTNKIKDLGSSYSGKDFERFIKGIH